MLRAQLHSQLKLTWWPFFCASLKTWNKRSYIAKYLRDGRCLKRFLLVATAACWKILFLSFSHLETIDWFTLNISATAYWDLSVYKSSYKTLTLNETVCDSLLLAPRCLVGFGLIALTTLSTTDVKTCWTSFSMKEGVFVGGIDEVDEETACISMLEKFLFSFSHFNLWHPSPWLLINSFLANVTRYCSLTNRFCRQRNFNSLSTVINLLYKIFPTSQS